MRILDVLQLITRLSCSIDSIREFIIRVKGGDPHITQITDKFYWNRKRERHLGSRIIISTQEPTISPELLDLCSMILVHRFTSPEWMRCLRAHLAAVSSDVANDTAKSEIEAKCQRQERNCKRGFSRSEVESQRGTLVCSEHGDGQLSRNGV